MLFVNKIALVTGAGRGLGRATAMALADEGAVVLLLGRKKDTLFEVQDEIKAMGGKADIVCCDLTLETQILSSIEKTINIYGRIDILVNNAAMAKEILFMEMKPKLFNEVICVDFYAPVILCRALLPFMIKNKGGVVVNVASGAGQRGLPGSSAYAAAKAALINFTKTVGGEVRNHGVRMNCICPGPMEPRTGFGESEKLRMHDTDLIKPETVVNTILYLASDMSNGVSCQVITARGANRW